MHLLSPETTLSQLSFLSKPGWFMERESVARLYCARRHNTTPSLRFPCMSPCPPLCLPCVSSGLRDSRSIKLRHAFATATLNVEPGPIQSAVDSSDDASSSVLEVLDALCNVVGDTAADEDYGLLHASKNAIVHLCFAGDRGILPSSIPSEEVTSLQSGLRFCRAVLVLSFSIIGSSSNSNNSGYKLRTAYVFLVNSICRVLLPERERLDGGITNAPWTLDLKESLGNSLEGCSILVEDLVLPSPENHPESIATTADVLSLLASASVEEVVRLLSEKIVHIFSTLAASQSNLAKERLLNLILVLLSMPSPLTRHASNESLPEKRTLKPVGPAKTSSGRIGKSTRTGLALADALKSCILSTCPIVRNRVSQIVGVLLSPACQDAERFSDVFAPSAGLVDYLFEALRQPTSAPEEGAITGSLNDKQLEGSLSLPVLQAISLIAKEKPVTLISKWSYGLPILLKAARCYENHLFIRKVFALIEGFTTGDISLPAFNTSSTRQILQLSLASGAQLNAAICNGSNDALLAELEKSFQSAVSGVEAFCRTISLPDSCLPLAVELIECVALVMPSIASGPRLTAMISELVLETFPNDPSEDIAFRLRHAALGLWGKLAVESFADSNAPGDFLVECLRLIAVTLDVRFFNDNADELRAAGRFFWQYIPPHAVFSRLPCEEHHDVCASGELAMPQGSYDLWGSSSSRDEMHPELESENHQNTVNAELESRGSAIRAYLARLYSLANTGDHTEHDNLGTSYRTLERTMPATFHEFQASLATSQRSEYLGGALRLLHAAERFGGREIMDQPQLLTLLLERADSESILSPPFAKFVLPLIRAIFNVCRDSLSLCRDITLSAELCDIALSSSDLECFGADEEFFLHIIELQDRELRIRAWNSIAKASVTSTVSKTSLETRLASLLGFNASAAKCLLSSCLEGTEKMRAVTINLIRINPSVVATSLLKVGLPAAVICAAEARQVRCDDSEGDTKVGKEDQELLLAQLIDIITLTIPFACRDDLSRMLMHLVDIFSSRQARNSLGAKYLDLSILRCLTTVLNESSAMCRLPRGAGDSCFYILDYIDQSGAAHHVSRLAFKGNGNPNDEMALHSKERDIQRSTKGVAVSLLDYVLRHSLLHRSNAEVGKEAVLKMWDVIPQEEKEWLELLKPGPQRVYDHAESCRRTSCILLLTTVVHCSLQFARYSLAAVRSAIGHELLILITSLATEGTAFLSSSAYRLLDFISAHEFQLFSGEQRLTNLASFKILYVHLGKRLFTIPESISVAEVIFLVGISSTICKSNPTNEKLPMALSQLLVSMESALQKADLQSSDKVQLGQFLDQVESSIDKLAHRKSDPHIKYLRSCASDLRFSLQDGKADPEDHTGWASTELLLGETVLIAAPLSSTYRSAP